MSTGPSPNRVLLPLQFSAAAEAGPGSGTRLYALQGQTMGTSWSLRCALDDRVDLVSLQRSVQAALDEVVAQMSTWDAGSDLSRFNAAEAGSWLALPEGMFTVLNCAQDLAQQTAGAYDITAGALVNCWGFGPGEPRDELPSDVEIRSALQRVGWSRLLIDAERRIALQPGGLYLDLSSIAKGYGVDRVAACVERAGVHHYLVEVGGELRGQGCKPDGSPWWVEVESVPDTESDAGRWIVGLDGLSIATSGDYRRYFERDSRRYAHTLDPRNGRPVRAAPASVTVLHAQCMQADALATALTVLGLQDGMAFAERHGIAALFVVRRRQDVANTDEFASSAWLALLDS
ncbi:FAD:protein FMN transferase [Hydrocarboniphaga sp.]|uniref:FAD:protein FMN transferase n=1 Tax=Hydrocarboniphaga sp. TaxID=2033016 RepID=UPI002608FA6B|nr:FAD:protein FMN transferase [Hydrocarboniphaga sp.]